MSTPYDADLHVEALLKLRDGTAKTVDLSKRRSRSSAPSRPASESPRWCWWPANTSTFRRWTRTSRCGSWREQPRLRALRRDRIGGRAPPHPEREHHGEVDARPASSSSTTRPASRRRRDFLYHLVGGTVEWSFSGTNQGCSYKAGPATFQIKPDGSMGSLNGTPWHIYRKEPVRGYYALGWNLPAGQRNHHLPERHASRPPSARTTFLEVGRPDPRAGRARERRAQGQLDERRALGWGLRRNLQLALEPES